MSVPNEEIYKAIVEICGEYKNEYYELWRKAVQLHERYMAQARAKEILKRESYRP